jgi:hypothetical protein
MDPLLLGRVEQLLDGLLNKRAPGFHRFGREIAVHDAPHVQMLRTVVLDELVALVVPDVFVETQIRLVDRRIRRPHSLIVVLPLYRTRRDGPT